MFFQPMGRRYFLRGLAGGLLLPYLPSVMPKAYAATGNPRRYVQILSSMGVFASRFFPSSVTLTPQGTTGVSAMPLTGMTSDISQIVGPAFNALKSKISIVRGCNVLAGSNLHNGSYPTCASGTPIDNYGHGAPTFPWSADTVLAESSTVYPDPTGKQRQVVFSPASGGYDNFSWARRNGSTQHVAATHDTASMLAKFTALGATPPPGPVADPKVVRQADVVQNVYADYKSLRDSAKISAADKARLEAYMTLINEVQQGLNTDGGTALPTCTKPTAEAETGNSDAKHRNQIKVLVAALACDLTRVASYALDVGYEPMHTWGHGQDVDNHANVQRQVAEKVAFLLTEMDKIQETGATLLDNSLVYFGNEFGEIQGNDPHVGKDMQVLIGGSAGGSLQTGYYIDYRATGRRPMNNLMVTFFNALGLSSADYQRESVVGFGEYNSNAASAQGLTKYLTNSERILPLPFLYKGTPLG